MSEDPVTVWMDQLCEADEEAAQRLWDHFGAELQASARRRLRPETRTVYDEEDAAQSAFQSVCAGLVAGRFPDLKDRNSLWRLLLVVTRRKVGRRHRHDQQDKRDARRRIGSPDAEDDFEGLIESSPAMGLTPQFAVEFMDTYEHFFAALEDPALQAVVELRLAGYTDAQTAARLNCSRRTIQRRLELIRRQWDKLDLLDE